MIIGIEASHANKKKRTGVEEVCFQIIQELKQIIPNEHKVILYSHKKLNHNLSDLPKNWQTKILYWPFSKGWSQVRLSLELFFKKPDIFFAPGQLVPLYCPKNTISIVHDSAFKVFPKLYNKLAVPYLHIMNKMITRKAKIVITPSQFSKDEFIRLYKYKAEKIRVIPWGYNEQLYNMDKKQEDSTELLKEFKINNPYFVSIGRLEEKKNTYRIIQAFNKFSKNSKEQYQLLLIGNKRVGFEKIQQQIQDSPYKDRIITPGWVAEEQLPYLLANSAAFIFPSLYEGFGLPLLEAMAVKTPVICSKNMALQEVGGDCVEYVDYDDVSQISKKIEKVVKMDSQIQQNIQRGSERIKNYNWKHTAKNVYIIMKNLAKNR